MDNLLHSLLVAGFFTACVLIVLFWGEIIAISRDRNTHTSIADINRRFGLFSLALAIAIILLFLIYLSASPRKIPRYLHRDYRSSSGYVDLG